PLRCCNPAEDSCTNPSRCGFNACVPERCSPNSGACHAVLPGNGAVPDGTPCEDGNSCTAAERPRPVFQQCKTACKSDGNPGCPAGNECVLLTGSPGSPANGYCCPYGTACQMPGGLCFALSGRTQNANDACRAGVCSYDIGPALPTNGGSAPEA